MIDFPERAAGSVALCPACGADVLVRIALPVAIDPEPMLSGRSERRPRPRVALRWVIAGALVVVPLGIAWALLNRHSLAGQAVPPVVDVPVVADAPEPGTTATEEELRQYISQAKPAHQLAICDALKIIPPQHPKVAEMQRLLGRATARYAQDEETIAGITMRMAMALRKDDVDASCAEILDACTAAVPDKDLVAGDRKDYAGWAAVYATFRGSKTPTEAAMSLRALHGALRGSKAAFHSLAAEYSPELHRLTFDELIDEVTRYYDNDRLDIIRKTRKLLDDLKPLGNITSMKEIEIGAISLMHYTHDPNKGKHEYGDFCTQYLAGRMKGLTHQQTIAKLDELGKF